MERHPPDRPPEADFTAEHQQGGRARGKARRVDGIFSGGETLVSRAEPWMMDDGNEGRKPAYAQTLSQGSTPTHISVDQNLEDVGGRQGILNNGNQDIPALSVGVDSNGHLMLTLSQAEKERLMRPWQQTLAVKLLGKTISYLTLKKKLEQLWARKGDIQIIDVENNFYFVRFFSVEDYDFALTGGPWLLFDHYLAVRKWEPRFKPYATKIHKLAVWVRLPGLHVECYDARILTAIGNLIGRTLKIDAHTAQQARVPMDFPPLTQTTMTSILAVVYYSGQIKRDDNSVTFECKNPKSFRINRGITLDVLKRNVNNIVVRPGDDRRVCDIHYRYPISWEHGRAKYDDLKLEDNGDVDTMFTAFSQYANMGPIELYADLRRSIDQILSACRKRSMDEIIAMCTDPESSSVISLTQP